MKDVRGEREPERGIGSEREIGGGRDRDRAEGEVGADRQQRSKERLVRREKGGGVAPALFIDERQTPCSLEAPEQLQQQPTNDRERVR